MTPFAFLWELEKPGVLRWVGTAYTIVQDAEDIHWQPYSLYFNGKRTMWSAGSVEYLKVMAQNHARERTEMGLPLNESFVVEGYTIRQEDDE